MVKDDSRSILSRLGIVEAYEDVRLTEREQTSGLYYYQCRHLEDDWSVPETIERKTVWVNFWGTVASTEPIPFNEDGLYELTKEEGEAISFLSLRQLDKRMTASNTQT